MATDDVTFFSEDHGFGLVPRARGRQRRHLLLLGERDYRALPDDEAWMYTFRRTDGAHDLPDRYSLVRRYADGSLCPTGVAT